MPAPLKQIRSTVAPGVQIAVWANEKGANCTIKKSYKDKDGKYVDSTTFYPSDLAALADCIHQTLAFLAAYRAQGAQQNAQDPSRYNDDEYKRQGVAKKVQQQIEAATKGAMTSDLADDDIPF